MNFNGLSSRSIAFGAACCKNFDDVELQDGGVGALIKAKVVLGEPNLGLATCRTFFGHEPRMKVTTLPRRTNKSAAVVAPSTAASIRGLTCDRAW